VQSAPEHQPGPSAKSALAGTESLKVDKPLSSQVERTTPDPPKPSCPKDARGSPGAGGAPTSPTRAVSGQDPAGTTSRPEPA
jgi:hypothetical protein